MTFAFAQRGTGSKRAVLTAEATTSGTQDGSGVVNGWVEDPGSPRSTCLALLLRMHNGPMFPADDEDAELLPQPERKSLGCSLPAHARAAPALYTPCTHTRAQMGTGNTSPLHPRTPCSLHLHSALAAPALAHTGARAAAAAPSHHTHARSLAGMTTK